RSRHQLGVLLRLGSLIPASRPCSRGVRGSSQGLLYLLLSQKNVDSEVGYRPSSCVGESTSAYWLTSSPKERKTSICLVVLEPKCSTFSAPPAWITSSR